MPTTHRLRTMVQISDLHIGSIESVIGDALGSRPASQPNLHLVFRSTCLACRTFGSLMVACSSWLASIPTIDRGTGAVFDEVLVARDIQLILSGHAHDSSTTRVISRGHHAQTILGAGTIP